MKRKLTIAGFILLLFLALFSALKNREEKVKLRLEPSYYFHYQRAYPNREIPEGAVRRARQQAMALRERAKGRSAPQWQEVGPYNIGGRITAVAADPTNPDIVYFGAADGGVFKSTDGGSSWEPIFDEVGVMSIGAIAVDPTDPDKIYVGTGEANSSGDSFDGEGIFLSEDGGQTWTCLGLQETAHINRIVINPLNPEVIYVAAMGKLFSTNPERGLYRSTDGGETWEKVLYVNDTTGCIDVAINPIHPETVYAAMWQRIRGPDYRISGGEGSGLWRSTDGGETWTELTDGLPQGDAVGRIGLALSPSNPGVIYAIYANHPGYFIGLYKSTDGGDTWTRTNDEDLSDLFSSYGWYFGNVRVDPQNPDVVYAMGLGLYKSTNGGESWYEADFGIHVDQHDLWIDPNDPNHLYIGNDGGFYTSHNGGSSWTKSYDLPITQFYDITVDYQNPWRVYGGTQDNGTVRTPTGSLNDWEIIYGGDGFHCIVDYTNPNVIFAEYQYGGLGKSTDGGNTFDYATYGIDPDDRRNWDTPVIMDPTDHNVLYYGTYRVYKTTNLAEYWTPVSGDLTNGPGSGNLYYGTITVIEISPVDNSIVYAGTDDGNLWVSKDGCSTWTDIGGELPDRYVTDIKADPLDAGRVYVSFSGYDLDEHTPYIFVSTDTGATWSDITDNLPQAPVNAIEIDPDNPDLVFVGTDFGVYYSSRGGGNWTALPDGMPMSVVMDMVFHEPTHTLLAGTHGRSIYKLDVSELEVSERTVSTQKRTFLTLKSNPVRDFAEIIVNLDEGSRVKLSLYDRSGRKIRERNLNFGRGTHSCRIDMSGLPRGLYILRAASGRKISTIRILKD